MDKRRSTSPTEAIGFIHGLTAAEAFHHPTHVMVRIIIAVVRNYDLAAGILGELRLHLRHASRSQGEKSTFSQPLHLLGGEVIR